LNSSVVGGVAWQIEPPEDPPKVVRHGLSSQEQFLADLTLRQRLKHPLEDVLLPTRQVWWLIELGRASR
jgi:hypothetical protein